VGIAGSLKWEAFRFMEANAWRRGNDQINYNLASTGGLTTSINMGFKRTSFGPTALGFKFWRHQVLL